MTARPFWDPVTGAAIAYLGLPILPALPCPTCGGKRWLRAPAPYDEVLPGRSCPDCTDGVWTPPDHPVTIGVTSAEPGGSYGDWDVYFDDISYSLGSEDADDNLVMHPIVPSSVIGEATLRALKVVEDIVHAPDVGPAAVDGEPTVFGGLIAETDWPHRLLLTTNRGSLDISSALPFLPGLKPGDTVYLADGFTESIECPECHGYCCLPIRLGSDGLFGGGGQCSACAGTGQLSCPFPVDAPDHPCVLEAT